MRRAFRRLTKRRRGSPRTATKPSAAKGEAERALAALPATAKLEAQLTAVRSDIESKRTRLAEARAEAQALAREAELAERRMAAIAEERQAWTGRRDSALAQITTIEERSREAKGEHAALADTPKIFAEKRRALIDEIEKAEAERRVAADRLAEAENVLSEADRAIRAALEALSAAREEAARVEEHLEGAKRRLTDIAHEIKDRLEVEPDAVAALAEIAEGEALPEVANIEAELEKLRRDRERLGAVNLRAEEELREVEEQHGKLTTERDDLVEAIKRLRQGILNLNKEARERLLASFEVVNGHFKRLFTELFGGGTAELQLIEHDDPLEAGLEILAKPPGKKPATLSLLSGGEQALTALALIFAVFLTNPGADLRARRSRCAARRSQRRALLRPARRDDALDRHALRHHHAQSDHHGAHEPAVRRHHGGTRRVATGLGRSRRRGQNAGSELARRALRTSAQHRRRFSTCSSRLHGAGFRYPSVPKFCARLTRSLALGAPRMSTTSWVILGVIVVVVLCDHRPTTASSPWRQRVNQAFADIDVQLKQRHDLIPNLVETVKGYAAHERGTLEAVVQARNAALAAPSVDQKVAAENMLSGALRQLFALSESYPELKANENFQQLQTDLTDIENKLAAARRFFNNAVQEYNSGIQQFPAVLFAGMLGFHAQQFFDLGEERAQLSQAPQVKF